MMNRYFAGLIVWMTYCIILLHNAVPHHHHSSIHEAQNHHLSELTDYETDGKVNSEHSSDSHNHDHQPHMVHSPDFGNDYFNSSLKFNLKPFWAILAGNFCDINFSFTEADQFTFAFQSSPPLKGDYCSLPYRGPPSC